MLIKLNSTLEKEEEEEKKRNPNQNTKRKINRRHKKCNTESPT